MRLAWGIMIAVCLGLPAVGGASQQQEGSVPPNTTGQTPAPPSTSNIPANEPLTEQRKETQAEPKTEPAKKRDATRVGAAAKRHVSRKRPPATAPTGAPRKIVVREGSVAEPTAQIVTGMPPEEANRQRQNAEQLLTSTDETLRRVDPGTLDAREQETVSQIRNYMEGVRLALKEGDISRAHALAVKAGLLADDLVKR